MLLDVCFLAVSRFVDVLRRQPTHRRVVLVEHPRVSGERTARPVSVVLLSAAGPLLAIYTSHETGTETSSHRRISARCDSMDVFLQCLLDDKTRVEE